MNKVGKEHLRSRRQIYEGDGSSSPFIFKVQILKSLVWKIPHLILKLVLKGMGLFERGRENALSLKVKNRVFKVEGLPEEWEGLRILFMSDLHFERKQELTDAIVEKIHSLKVDLCLFGGDFQRERSKFLDPAIEGMKKIVGTVEASFGFYAVLGNHDTIELVSELENIGVHVLMNESIKLEKNFLHYIWSVWMTPFILATMILKRLLKMFLEMPLKYFYPIPLICINRPV